MTILANITVLLLASTLIRMVMIAYKCFKLIDAIYAYRLYCLKHYEKPNVDFDDEARFSDIFFNLRKWRYTDILPKDKFELVKQYMK